MRLWEELHVGMISAWMGKGDIPQRAYWEPEAPFLPGFVREISHIECTGHGFFGSSFPLASFQPGSVGRVPFRSYFSLDMYKKHYLGRIPGMGL